MSGTKLRTKPSLGGVGTTKGLEVGGKTGLDPGTALEVEVGVNAGVNVDVDVERREGVEVGAARALVVCRGAKKAKEE